MGEGLVFIKTAILAIILVDIMLQVRRRNVWPLLVLGKFLLNCWRKLNN